MTERNVTAKVLIHTLFKTNEPLDLFMVGVEVLEGRAETGHFLNIPFNPVLAMTVKITGVSRMENDFGFEMSGLCLDADGGTGFSLLQNLKICGEVLDVTLEGEE